MSELPDGDVDRIERLTRLARRATDEAEAEAYRTERDELAAAHGFVARVRSEETREVLVLYPAAWVEDGTVRTDRIDDLDRAVERHLAGTADEDRFEAVDAENRDLVADVEAAAGPIHAANAAAFADFMGNHYVRRMVDASPAEVREFLAEYYPRNAWPTDEQKAVVEESIELVFSVAGECPPEGLGGG